MRNRALLVVTHPQCLQLHQRQSYMIHNACNSERPGVGPHQRHGITWASTTDYYHYYYIFLFFSLLFFGAPPVSFVLKRNTSQWSSSYDGFAWLHLFQLLLLLLLSVANVTLVVHLLLPLCK